MYQTLNYFGFGPSFKNMMHTFYNNISSSVSLSSGTSSRFIVRRGIRQGCPISPFLFLLVAETLNLYTVHCSQIKGIEMEDFTLTISQLADDTCLFLKNKDQVPVILEALKLFSDASGLSVNHSKSEIMAVHRLDDSCISGIQVKQTVRYLGIVISKSASERITKNFHKDYKRQVIFSIVGFREIDLFKVEC